ncbi:MAG: RsmB/NOP family class I SAM-dependent RNA methyltransferase [Paracoccaceae bacterium]
MTPAARLAAAAGILDRILSGEPAEKSLTSWARGSRYAGSGDRAAVRDNVFDALRRRRSLAVLSGAAQPETGRSLMIGLVRERGENAKALFSGTGYALAPLSETEREALARPARTMSEAEALDVPDWQMPLFQASLGPGVAEAISPLRRRSPVYLRANLAICDRAAAMAELESEGIGCETGPLAATAIRVNARPERVRASRAYLGGLVELQDAAGQAAVALVPLRDGMRVLDYCAGGGGKTLALAARAAAAGFAVRLHAHDADAGRMSDLPVRARRAGFGSASKRPEIRLLETGAADRHAPYDLVLLDVPCSGSGTWARGPDAKWRLTRERLDRLLGEQAGLLEAAAGLVAAHGGTIVYMTCSLFAAENADQITAFLARHDGWSVADSRQFLPAEGGDGFFVAILAQSGT